MIDTDFFRFTDDGPLVMRLGMGCWAVGGHGWGTVKDDESIDAIQYAFERGVTLFDTADVYGFGKSEIILRQALGSKLKSVYISTKGGVRWDESGKVWNDSSPKYLTQAAESSLRRLGIEQIPLYYLHKPDNQTPLSEIMAGLLKLKADGKIGEIGVSNFSAAQLADALTLAPVRAVQVRFNLLQRTFGEELAPLCHRHNVKLVAWGALADGLLTGKFNQNSTFHKDDHRSRLPDFQGEKFIENLRRVEALRIIARKLGLSPGHLALRWIMDRYEWSCPLFGAKTVSQVEENLRAVKQRLSVEEMADLDEHFGYIFESGIEIDGTVPQ